MNQTIIKSRFTRAKISSRLHSLLKEVEIRFTTLTTLQLYAIIFRAGFVQSDLEDINGSIHNNTLVNILMRRYIFGIITILFKQIPLDVFRYIGKFFDFNINLQAYMRKYVSQEHKFYMIEFTNLLRIKDIHPTIYSQDIIRYKNNSTVLQLIKQFDDSCSDYYYFVKQEKRKYNMSCIQLSIQKIEATQEFKRTQNLDNYTSQIQLIVNANYDINIQLKNLVDKWLYEYAPVRFPNIKLE